MIFVKRGEVWWIDFEHSVGGEIQKNRPAVIISNDYANQYSNRVQIIPLTSKIEKCYPCEAYVLVGDHKSKATSSIYDVLLIILELITVLKSKIMSIHNYFLFYNVRTLTK